MSDEPQRPTNDDRDARRAYWQALGMPWRADVPACCCWLPLDRPL
jgi:hypothetical protein